MAILDEKFLEKWLRNKNTIEFLGIWEELYNEQFDYDEYYNIMDMYIRMYDELKKSPDDNPTLGIVLCSETDEDIARYSILHGNEQLFTNRRRTERGNRSAKGNFLFTTEGR